MNTVLLIGGAGYVGSHCAKGFADAGWNVVTYDNLSRGWRDMVRWGELIEGDILDLGALKAAVGDVRPDVIAHFAAFAYVGESVEQPAKYYENNTLGSFNVLEAMRATGVDKIVFSSTCATYGAAVRPVIDETHPQAPMNPYGWSKLFVERMLIDYRHAYGVNYVGLRYFNAAGADLGGEIGERHEPETHMIPLAVRGALSDDYEFTIYGDQFDTRDGTAVRDYIHVNDLAAAHVAAAQHLIKGGSSEFINLATGVGTSVMEMATAIEAAAGRPMRRKIGSARPGDPPALVASNAKAASILGWKPEHSSIDTIVRSAWAWHEKDAKRAAE